MIDNKTTYMTTICIVRHGETDWNAQKRCQGREDIELNENGEKQAAEIAGHLKRVNWDIIISSPLKRAFATAAIIGRCLNVNEIIEDDSFIERDYGVASGLTYEQWKLFYPDGYIPGIESDDILRERVLQGLHSIVEEFKDKKVVLVAHGAVINSLLKTVSVDKINLGETNIKNTCINIVEHDGSDWHVKVYNSVDYLNDI